jgi:hypothetical protein
MSIPLVRMRSLFELVLTCSNARRDSPILADFDLKVASNFSGFVNRESQSQKIGTYE